MLIQSLLDQVYDLCRTGSCEEILDVVVGEGALIATTICGAVTLITGQCIQPNVAVNHAPGQPFADYVLATGSCSDKSVTTVMTLPAGVTDKSVLIQDLDDCQTGIGQFKSVGTPGSPETEDAATAEETGSSSDPVSAGSKCYSATGKWIHGSITIQGVAGDDLAWLRGSMRRLRGCNSTWWSEAPDYPYPSKVFAYSGKTYDFHWWEHEQFPYFEWSDWNCHPPAECNVAGQRAIAGWRIEPFSPCGHSVKRIFIRMHAFTHSDGRKTVFFTKDGHCNGLMYPEESVKRNRRDREDGQATPGWYGGEPRDVYCYAIPGQLQSCPQDAP